MGDLPDKAYIVIYIAGILLITFLLTRLNRIIFKRIYKVQEGLHLRFFERIISAAIIVVGLILALSSFGGLDTVLKTALGGTAFISAVLIFAAQDTIKDILAGLMISIYKPFEIGNRVELEDGTTGIVKDITMRHVVLQLLDSQVLVIPNSRLNTMTVRNFSYHSDRRAAQFEFYIAYGSDVEKAMRLIREAVAESPLSLPAGKTADGAEYGPVYFLAYEDSSLRLATTVYYEASSPSEVVITDINLRVNKIFAENGIEIPYQYINVVQKPDKAEEILL